MKKFKLRIGLDVDDILFSCNDYAVALANAKGAFDPPLSVNEISSWGMTGTRIDSRLKYFADADFFDMQPVLPGAKEFVRELLKRAEVFFTTAVAPEYMGIRAKRLMEEFPEVPKENIIMGYRKDLVNLDIILDDGAHNVIASKSAYPVLMRKPWNGNMTGCLSVNNYPEFLTLVDTILNN